MTDFVQLHLVESGVLWIPRLERVSIRIVMLKGLCAPEQAFWLHPIGQHSIALWSATLLE